MELEANRVYLVGVVYPASLNGPSPVKPIQLVGDWHTENAERATRNVRNIHRHVALVLHYDSVTHVAVIFLESTQPRYPQRYLPWQGAPRLPYQTDRTLHVQGGSLNRGGYLNFTHALRVRVIQEHEIGVQRTRPGLASVHHFQYRGEGEEPEVLRVVLGEGGLDTLKVLHDLYWAGARYDIHGNLIEGSGGGSGGSSTVHDSLSTAGSTGASLGGSSAPGGPSQLGGPSPRGSSQLGGPSQLQDLSEEELFTFKLGEALRWEEMRNEQIDLLEGEGDYDVASLPLCVFEAPTVESLAQVGHRLEMQYDVMCSP